LRSLIRFPNPDNHAIIYRHIPSPKSPRKHVQKFTVLDNKICCPVAASRGDPALETFATNYLTIGIGHGHLLEKNSLKLMSTKYHYLRAGEIKSQILCKFG
jgi:hypothetical protein